MSALPGPAAAAERIQEQDQAANVSGWAEQVAKNSEEGVPIATQSTAELPLRPSATLITHDSIRGTSVKLSIPLDGPVENATVRPSDDPVDLKGAPEGNIAPYTRRAHYGVLPPKRKTLRRDSLERREALLKGKEGSRRRQRWENGQLLSNPWAEPPLPSDWQVQPTHPRTVVPYFLAPLWEADANQRARRQSRAARAKAQTTLESRTSVLPRELRQKLKRTRSARSLLVDLETQVRIFLEEYHRSQTLRMEAVEEEDDEAILQSSEDEELVFVGRQGQMKDIPPSPKTRKTARRRGRSPGPIPSATMTAELEDVERTGTSGDAGYRSDDDLIEISVGENEQLQLSNARECLIFDAPASDKAASFARWIVHSIADYYGLRTWSVTVGDPARREAYVGIDADYAAAGRPSKAARSSYKNKQQQQQQHPRFMKTGQTSASQPILPQPLWAMV